MFIVFISSLDFLLLHGVSHDNMASIPVPNSPTRGGAGPAAAAAATSRVEDPLTCALRALDATDGEVKFALLALAAEV